MSENATDEQRTEMPTDRRIEKLRGEGQIHSSQEIVQVISLITAFSVLTATWGWFFRDIKLIFSTSFRMIAEPRELTVDYVKDGAIAVGMLIGPEIVVMVVTVAIMASLALFLQTDFNFKEKKIHFQWSFLNPLTGLARIFSIVGLVNLLKALVKLAIILPIVYLALKRFAPEMVKLVHLNVEQVLAFAGDGVGVLFWRVMYVLIALAIFDYFWGKFQWLKKNRMTKEEVKDERKSVEGDEETKRKIINKGLQRIMQRIRDSVRRADVVVTNPTHFAVALQYDRTKMRAPRVVAKGADFLALRIRELAKEAGVPVLERKTLARALYASTEVGSEIPYDLFRAVAEVMAYVYRIKGGPSSAKSTTGSGAASI